MLEIPESKTIGFQAANTLTGKKITDVFTATSKHKFTAFKGDPAGYPEFLTGRQIQTTRGHGMFVDLLFDKHISLTIGEGTNMRYYSSFEKPPDKYQLLLVFNDDSVVAFNVAMYGGIWAYEGEFDNKYHHLSLKCISPLDDAFNESCFDELFRNTSKNISLKALLATEQRIPGLGNGVLQDILFNAELHPKRKKSTLTDFEEEELFHSLKTTLKKMTRLGGRDTEKDLYGNNGGYRTILSKNTVKRPCPNCGHEIVKEAYLGGAIYFCPNCQSA
ncbi:MAG: endonuclease VIII [Bacteroidales bacterium]|nr:endonuclease VIII [Bacteroidales bacterium]